MADCLLTNHLASECLDSSVSAATPCLCLVAACPLEICVSIMAASPASLCFGIRHSVYSSLPCDAVLLRWLLTTPGLNPFSYCHIAGKVCAFHNRSARAALVDGRMCLVYSILPCMPSTSRRELSDVWYSRPCCCSMLVMGSCSWAGYCQPRS